MHPELQERRRSLNIERFAAARRWTETNVSAFDIESTPVHSDLFPQVSTPFQVAAIRKATRRWQLALVFSLTVLAPSTAAAVLLALTGGIS